MVRRHGGTRWKIVGKLHKTGRFVKPVRVSKRMIFIDKLGQQWVKIFNKWWKFPEEIEY